MTHKHHIIPKHMGGTDDPSNLITLTVEEHALAHKKIYEEHGKREDYLAWKALSKQIGNEEIWLRRSSIGGRNNMGKPKSEEHRKKLSKSVSKYLTGKYKEGGHGEELKRKISESMKGNTNSKNHSSEEYKRKQSLAMKKAWEKRKEKLD